MHVWLLLLATGSHSTFLWWIKGKGEKDFYPESPRNVDSNPSSQVSGRTFTTAWPERDSETSHNPKCSHSSGDQGSRAESKVLLRVPGEQHHGCSKRGRENREPGIKKQENQKASTHLHTEFFNLPEQGIPFICWLEPPPGSGSLRSEEHTKYIKAEMNLPRLMQGSFLGWFSC